MKVAIIGGGQLARMLAMAGLPLGLQFSFLLDSKDRSDTRCIDGLGDIALLEPDCDWRSVYAALGKPDVITVEKEQIDPAVLEGLSAFCPVRPSPQAFTTCSYRQHQKQLLTTLDIATANYRYLAPGSDTLPVDGELTFPLFAKSTHNAYDGKNQFVLKTPQELVAFWQAHSDGSWIVEEAVRFEREISIIAVRSQSGEMAFYPAVENHHRNGILIYSISPVADITAAQEQTLVDYARTVMEAMDYVGVLAIECFDTASGLVVNEMAPRVHNSGHWTSNGSITCQFENHLRAITGLALGATDSIGHTAMINLLGVEAPPLDMLDSRSSLHWYNKASRPGRKVGHINLQNESGSVLRRDVLRLVAEVDRSQANVRAESA